MSDRAHDNDDARLDEDPVESVGPSDGGAEVKTDVDSAEADAHGNGANDGAATETVEGAGDSDDDLEAMDAPELPDPSVLRLDHVSLWYQGVIAVNDVSALIEPGITGLLGPNGAGKSSLIRMIMGLVRPQTGSVRVLGEDPWNNARLMTRIGYVPEAPAPWQDESGRDAALHAAGLAGMERADAEAAVDAALERVGLTAAAHRKVSTYSHGMQQRLKFALAMLHDPELYIMDEPLLGADPLARRDLIRLMQSLAAEGKSILLSTHVLPDVESLTDRILVLNHGRLIAHGDVGRIRDLLEQYPRTVRIQSTDPRRVGAAIWDWPSVASLQVEHEALVVRTKEPGDFFPRLQSLLAQGELPFSSVRVPDESVEAVFRYLVD